MLSRRTQIALVLLAAVVLRLLIHHTYLPWWVGDSRGYTGPAAVIYTHHFEDWDGGRTPSYPLFVLGCELLSGAQVEKHLTPPAGYAVATAQTLLGIAAVLLVYLTMEGLGIRAAICFIMALLYALLEPIAEYEMVILSESFCLFLLVLAAYVIVRVLHNLQAQRPTSLLALGAGAVSGFAILTRPNVPFTWALFLGFLPVIAYFWKSRGVRLPLGAVCRISGLCGLSGAVLISAWLLFNWENTGNFGITPMTGLTRTFPAYNLFDKVHPEDKVLGDIMVKYYRLSNQDGNIKQDYIWQAFPEIFHHYFELPFEPKRGPFPTVYIDKYLGRVSNYLLWENPGTWLQNSWQSFLGTMDFNIYQGTTDLVDDPVSLYGTPVVKSVGGWRVCVFLAAVDARLMLGFYFMTFACVAVSTYQLFQAREVPELLRAFYCLVLALGALLSMVGPCVLAAYYNRFAIPLIPAMVVCSAWVIEFVVKTWRKEV
jgi:hypothetical protein